MIVRREPDEITTWLVAFYKEGSRPWMRFIPGRFKHVSAFAWSPRALCWVWYDFGFTHTSIMILPGGTGSQELLGLLMVGSSILKVQATVPRAGPRLGLWCVVAIKHLLGLRCGAVTPAGLWKHCVRNGAEIVFDGGGQTPDHH